MLDSTGERFQGSELPSTKIESASWNFAAFQMRQARQVTQACYDVAMQYCIALKLESMQGGQTTQRPLCLPRAMTTA